MPVAPSNLATQQPEPDQSNVGYINRGWVGEWVAAWGMLLIWSFLRVPIPAVNEPHYLTKAKHFWSPDWCANDFFLNSSNPHLVFYATFGWLTRFLSLYDTAIIGRCIGLLVLSFGWQALVRTLTKTRWASLAALVIFLLLHALGNWSGEWLVGGIESKVLAYGLLFSAIAFLLNRKILLAGFMAGAAFSFHPVIGAWGAITAALATIMQFFFSTKDARLFEIEDWKAVLLAGGVYVLAAAPGLWPALETLSTGDPETVAKAELLQVGSRLKHHLDPMTFPKSDHRYFGVLIACWGCLVWFGSHCGQQNSHQSSQRKKVQNWWRAFVVATLIIAACGVAIAWGSRPMKEMPGYEWRIKLLKLYPFRLADLMVPIAVSIGLVSVTASFRKTNWQRSLICVGLAAAFGGSIAMPGADQNPGRMSPSVATDWNQICRWIKSNTPNDTMVYAINEQWALRWYADRAEYVNYKDCPQDAEGMVEWNNRLWAIHRWKRACFEDGVVSEKELGDLYAKTGIGWFIVSRFGPIAAEPVHSNHTFKVYDLQSFHD